MANRKRKGPKTTALLNLTVEAKQLLEALSDKLNMSMSSIGELAIRDFAKRQKISLPVSAGNDGEEASV